MMGLHLNPYLSLPRNNTKKSLFVILELLFHFDLLFPEFYLNERIVQVNNISQSWCFVLNNICLGEFVILFVVLI